MVCKHFITETPLIKLDHLLHQLRFEKRNIPNSDEKKIARAKGCVNFLITDIENKVNLYDSLRSPKSLIQFADFHADPRLKNNPNLCRVGDIIHTLVLGKLNNRYVLLRQEEYEHILDYIKNPITYN